jgi:hypothetical protein
MRPDAIASVSEAALRDRLAREAPGCRMREGLDRFHTIASGALMMTHRLAANKGWRASHFSRKAGVESTSYFVRSRALAIGSTEPPRHST